MLCPYILINSINSESSIEQLYNVDSFHHSSIYSLSNALFSNLSLKYKTKSLLPHVLQNVFQFNKLLSIESDYNVLCS